MSWRIENKLPQSPAHRSYGIHHNDPRKVPPSEYHVDLCISVETEVLPNSYGIINKIIPACRCATVRHIGSRENIIATQYLYEEWLPNSKEQRAEFPIFFHYVNVGPQVLESEMITDIYLPIR
ncbi:GyrI-like domain-containing protein [uncultured Desulfuromusa sp.]|uniref:AraC family transcriptional regulator n=1 Tax=uncultured Desulfuromusa sp. TaxID=219183 RepID=UPI003747D70F